MNDSLHRADEFNRDFDFQYRWYLEQAGEGVAERYLEAVRETLHLLVAQPGIGQRRKFHHPGLQDIRSFRLISPFEVHLLFYRYSGNELVAERLMHGARDLPRRLMEPSGP